MATLSGLLAAALAAPTAFAADGAVRSFKLDRPLIERAAAPAEAAPIRTPHPGHADFRHADVSRDTRSVADWVIDSGDSRGMPFAIVDKKNAKVFVFDADGRLRGTGAALLGMAVGDRAVPGIGERALSTIRPEERTTPAGRFVASLDRNLRGKEILWVDYDGAVSMHPVVSAKPEERRLQRLASPTPQDNRISYGCINVSPQFFDSVVRPAFTGTNGIVYVLPETMSNRAVFGSYEVKQATGL